jgi:hypothetical protein
LPALTIDVLISRASGKRSTTEKFQDRRQKRRVECGSQQDRVRVPEQATRTFERCRFVRNPRPPRCDRQGTGNRGIGGPIYCIVTLIVQVCAPQPFRVSMKHRRATMQGPRHLELDLPEGVELS